MPTAIEPDDALDKQPIQLLQDAYPTKDGGKIILNAGTKEHLTAHPEAARYIQEAFALVELPQNGSELSLDVDLHRPLGRSGCLVVPEAGLDDVAQFAFRTARRGASRIVIPEGELPMVSTLAIKAIPTKYSKTYRLLTAYVGTLAPREPWDASPDQFEESIAFWSCHALVYTLAVMGEPFSSTWREVIAQAQLS
jgi:hypothetical protein